VLDGAVAERLRAAHPGLGLAVGCPGVDRHWFGSDAIGRDAYARALAGRRLSLTIGLLSSVVALVIGPSYGAVAGLAGGRVERAMLALLFVSHDLAAAAAVAERITVLEAGRIVERGPTA
jgi:oligopeptide transport system permease protein